MVKYKNISELEVGDVVKQLEAKLKGRWARVDRIVRESNYIGIFYTYRNLYPLALNSFKPTEFCYRKEDFAKVNFRVLTNTFLKMELNCY